MILKSACENNQCYIDRLITIFMKVLTKMTQEHLKTQENTTGNRTAQSVPDSEKGKSGMPDLCPNGTHLGLFSSI